MIQNEVIVLLKDLKSSQVNVHYDLNLNCKIVHTIFEGQESSYWYFDSVYSRHTTIDKSFFTNMVLINDWTITFRDGNKVIIYGHGSISVPRI